MQRCIVSGHTFMPFKGAGEYTGQTFMICIECNKTVPIEVMWKGAERMLEHVPPMRERH